MFAHIDVDAFFASVLVRKDPRLKGKPLLALGMGGGCVIAASYEAKAKGVKTGMRLLDARKLCPGAVELLSDFTEACVASEQIEDLLRREFPIVEQMSVDEWFVIMDTLAGGAPKNMNTWAQDFQNNVERMTALTVSIGIAPTKILAKMASEYKKPVGITVLEKYRRSKVEGRNASSDFDLGISDFLKDRPAAAIPGIGRKRDVHAQKHGWLTAWDFAHADPGTVVHLFGRPGRELQQEIQGISVYPVEEDDRPPKSVSRCRSFRPTADRATVYAHLLEHLTYIVLKMRRQDLACRHLSVWLRDGEYEGDGKGVKLPRPMNTEEEILPFARICFDSIWSTQFSKKGAKRGSRGPRAGAPPLKGKDSSWKENRRFSFHECTQIGLALYDLVPAGARQYSLFEETKDADRRTRIQEALDEIHKRYGRNAVVRASATADFLKRKQKTPDLYGDPAWVV